MDIPMGDIAMLMTALVASLDEWHQSFIPLAPAAGRMLFSIPAPASQLSCCFFVAEKFRKEHSSQFLSKKKKKKKKKKTLARRSARQRLWRL